MPNIVFASNNIAHFPTALTGSVPGTFDEDRVPYTLALTNEETVTSPFFSPVAGDVTWIHFRTYFENPAFADTNKPDMVSGFDIEGNKIFGLRKQASTYLNRCKMLLYDGNTSINANNNVSLTLSKINFVDIKITVNALLIEMEVYINGSFSGDLSFNSNPEAIGKPVRLAFGPGMVINFSHIQHFSEIIVADEDTRNARLDLLRPVALGALNDWNGPVAALADEDTTTGMTTTSASQRQSLILSDYGGATNISNLVFVSSTTRGISSPTKLQHFIRQGGVNYDSPIVHDIDFSLAYQVTDFKINPATSLPWVSSDLTSIEPGFVSVA